MAVLQVLLGIAYPVLIFMALSWLEPRQIALAILALTGLRFFLSRPALGAQVMKEVWVLSVCVVAVVGITAAFNDPIGFMMTPVLVNAVFLGSFGLSLRSDRPMVERFARLQVEGLSDDEVRYCRSVTWIWCAFFVANGSICLHLALARELEIWALYTGLVSYVLMGMLFAGEYVYRHWRFRRYVGGFADPLLMRVFPPRSPAPGAEPEA